MAAAMVWWPWSLVLLSFTCETSAFYVPGVAPINFHQNDPVEIKAVKLTSSRTQLPYEYYSLPFCQPSKITYKAENLGEVLRGDRIVNTPFQVLMNSEKKCEVLCSQSSKPVTLTVEQSRLVAERIAEDYYVHLIADNLPVATRLELYSNRDNDDKKKEKDVQFEHGYRLGFTDVNKIYLHNHLSFILYYHREDMEEDQEHTYRVVRFEVIPQSIRLEDLKADEKSSCTLPEGTNSSPQEIDPNKENQLYFTYSVHWEESDIKWASRWDTYLTMSDVQIHWFSIINSVVVVFFLSGILSMIIIRTLRKDIANYNKEDDIEDTMEESGWKLVHGDVFRPPQYPMILSSLLGSGIQLFCMILIVIFVAMLGMLSPSSRGALMTTACFLFMFMGVFGGFSAGRLYRTLKGHRWKKGAFCTATLYPGVVFGICFVLNCFIWGKHSSGAVPFPTMVALLCMWFGISLPLVYLGYYFGFRKQPYDNPVRTNQIPRQIPEQRWYMNRFVGILMAGILPFGAMFIELFFIFSVVCQGKGQLSQGKPSEGLLWYVHRQYGRISSITSLASCFLFSSSWWYPVHKSASSWCTSSCVQRITAGGGGLSLSPGDLHSMSWSMPSFTLSTSWTLSSSSPLSSTLATRPSWSCLSGCSRAPSASMLPTCLSARSMLL
ncbi:transmembrane 9 superfamily member 4 isoform X2 [Castor canadensis]|uniref:Transmembrane 9 superfamily member 4 isoform X2 n=1 Tax=Castor canadensis TaxID=51338 RepID=A0AC58MMJ4_CASCN